VESSTSGVETLMSKYAEIIHRMAGISMGEETVGQTIPIVVGGDIIHMSFGGRIDIDLEKAKLQNKIQKLTKNKEEAFSRLSNEDFLAKATEDVIQEQKNRIESIDEQIQKIDYVIKSLGVM
jgi:valyl-tRNA synthetase